MLTDPKSWLHAVLVISLILVIICERGINMMVYIKNYFRPTQQNLNACFIVGMCKDTTHSYHY